jgi:hypothetical protein
MKRSLSLMAIAFASLLSLHAQPAVTLKEIPEGATPPSAYITGLQLKRYTLFIFPYFGDIPEEIGSSVITLKVETLLKSGFPFDEDSSNNKFLGPGGGQHIELIINDDANTAHISTSTLLDVEPSTTPVLFRAFTCKANNECYKDQRCFRAAWLPFDHEEADTITSTPMITYNLPGSSVRTRTAILDFMLANVRVDENRNLQDHKVRVTILDITSGGTGTTVCDTYLTRWAAQDILGLTKGHTYQIDLRIVDKTTQQTVNEPYATTRRLFKVDLD